MVKMATKYLGLLKEYNTTIKAFLGSDQVDKVDVAGRKASEAEPDYSYEWKYLAILIDRLIFILFSAVIPVCLVLMYIQLRIFEPVQLD